MRFFGKPEIDGARRLGVALATGENVEEAVIRAKKAVSSVIVKE
ncbi:phosphoribosylglycinamide formyltransferase 2 [Salmonella enterica subsp. arizonae]|uniref:Phosphoribosylglycinamide formyltransferase 2 n=1 Tax=Salmonella enterica subsp. arizonae TaxID=59203 RepID=A0A379TCX4_SALER|nr:phosphoribosylglycinamide formyltransferase 2 [Salmonella enterica subsp. arizonae]